MEPYDADGKVRKSFLDAGGYIPKLLDIIFTKLNLTAELTVTKGFGVIKNGSWNGMVGVLVRQVNSQM